MLTDHDQRNMEKTVQTANLLVQDLRELMKSANPLLADIALELLQQAAQVEQRLNRIEASTREEEKTS